MLTRGGVSHQYGFAGYYSEPYHVLMLADAYPDEGRPAMATYYMVPLNPAVMVTGGAGFRPYVGMDPYDPGTWTRPYAPTEGMFARLHSDQAAAADQEPRRRRAAKGGRRRD